MSTKLGMTRLYLNIGEFQKILKLKDYKDMEIIDIKKDDVGQDIEFKIVAPVDSCTNEIVVPYDNHYDIKRRGICLETPEDSWYIGFDKDDLDKSDEELGKLIKEKCTSIMEDFKNIETINLKIFLNKKYE